jgi:hypothetical protein
MKNAPLLLGTAEQDLSSLPESVKQVLESQTFEKSPALRALLAYLWEQRAAPLSEYAIATEALGRSSSFDARTDATVRVQVSRLRQRLEKFYEKENRLANERLVIPVGSHQITLEYTGSALAPLQSPERVPVVTLSRSETADGVSSRRFWVLCSVALLTVCLAEAVLLYRAKITVRPTPATSIPRLWRDFFADGRPAQVALPTPTFFSFSEPDKSAVMFRDTKVNDFSKGVASPFYRFLERSLGQPSLAENYTVTSDTFASVKLTRYLDQFKLDTTVTSSADDPLGALDRENVIAVGTWGTLRPLQPYLDRMNFRLGPHESYVESQNPQPNEPKRIEQVTESAERSIWPGVIGFLPAGNGQTHLLVLASRHTLALVCFVTESNGLAQLEKLWRSKGSPQYFEVAVNAELSGRGVVRVWPVALHAFRKTP